MSSKTSTFTDIAVSAPADTDIWKKPPTHDVFNAPYKVLTKTKLPAFSSVELTFSAPYVEKFDQAGVLFIMTDGAGRRTWIKAGVEYFNSAPQVSFVGCDNYADWSVRAVADATAKTTTLKLVRTDYTLWAYEVLPDGSELPFRECTWLWAGEEDKTLEICAYACRPAKGVEGQLDATFEKFDVTLKE